MLEKMIIQKEGEDWKEMRSAVSPIFTSGKLKKICTSINAVSADLEAHLDKFSASGEEVNARDVSSKFAAESFGKFGFGIDVNIFEECPESALFHKMVRRILASDTTTLDAIKFAIAFSLPSLNKIFQFPTMDIEAVKFFIDVLQQTMEMRKNQTAKRNDMVELLSETLSGQNAQDEEVRRQVEEELEVARPKKNAGIFKEEDIEDILVANLLGFILVGQDFAASTISVCMCCLANNPNVQERLFGEVEQASSKNVEIDYNTIMNMQYLDMVVHESLRIHFPTSDLERVCNKDYKVPGTDFTIPKGMMVQMSGSGIMMDERYFPNPREFNPENFHPSNKMKRNPYASLIMFGIGPRNCIGSRLALLLLKTGIINVIRKFKILPTARTPKKLEIDPKSTRAHVKGGIWVKFERRM